MRRVTITRDDWLKAIRDVRSTPPEANDPSVLTLAEIGELLGVGKAGATAHVKRLLDAGRAERTRKFITRGDGFWYPAPAYRLIPTQEASRVRTPADGTQSGRRNGGRSGRRARRR